MRVRDFILSACLGAASTLLGCTKPAQSINAQPAGMRDEAVQASPTLDELPDLSAKYERTIAAKVSVQDMNRPPRVRIVQDYKEPPLTAEEKAATGADQPKPGDDLLAFYRPERGPEHGVHPHETRVTAAAYGHGGTFV